ncbi:MAG: pentapeptide repeat-containing protein [Nostocaceae cyanobacterium]|nr:pentapeptide repeat-containing protein [Nostocaceae cyanobacterium]
MSSATQISANLTDASFSSTDATEANFKDARNVIFDGVLLNNTIMPDGTIQDGRCWV